VTVSDTCPTCGSDKREVRYFRGRNAYTKQPSEWIPHRLAPKFWDESCTDTWHTPPIVPEGDEVRNPLMTSWEVRAAAIIAGSLAEVDSPYAGGAFSDYRTHAINLCAAFDRILAAKQEAEAERDALREALVSAAHSLDLAGIHVPHEAAIAALDTVKGEGL
jgi:hypothetical protein